MDVVVRPAEREDAAAIARAHVRAWQAAYRGIAPQEALDQLSIEQRTEEWDRWLASGDPARATWVALGDGAVIGFARAGPTTDDDGEPASTGELYAINIEPDAWRLGAGRALVAAVESFLADQGYRDASLWVAERNERARRFYETLGWRADGTAKNAAVFAISFDEVRYRKPLV